MSEEVCRVCGDKSYYVCSSCGNGPSLECMEEISEWEDRVASTASMKRVYYDQFIEELSHSSYRITRPTIAG